MDTEVIRLLERDLEKAKESRDWTRPENNHEIIKKTYLDPLTNNSLVLPMGHPDGKFVYFRKLFDVLEEVLQDGYLPKDSLPEGCPRYLEELVR